jgi:hypothetical protein
VLRISSVSKRAEVPGGWRKLLDEELHKICFSPYITEDILTEVVLESRPRHSSF